MVKTHEINLETTAFSRFTSSEYIILEAGIIEAKDYILFKEVKTVDNVTIETGLYRMTQVKDIVSDPGLKDGYALIIVTKL